MSGCDMSDEVERRRALHKARRAAATFNRTWAPGTPVRLIRDGAFGPSVPTTAEARVRQTRADPVAIVPLLGVPGRGHAISELQIDSDVPKRKRYFRTPPELNDGESWSPLPLTSMDTLRDMIEAWATEASHDDALELGFVYLTDAEVAALPEI